MASGGGVPALWVAWRGCGSPPVTLTSPSVPRNPVSEAGSRDFPTTGSLASPNMALSCAYAQNPLLGCSLAPKLFLLFLSAARGPDSRPPSQSTCHCPLGLGSLGVSRPFGISTLSHKAGHCLPPARQADAAAHRGPDSSRPPPPGPALMRVAARADPRGLHIHRHRARCLPATGLLCAPEKPHRTG